MKRVLIITPHFPPLNAADMHRVRQSLGYYLENKWEVEVVVVNPHYSNVVSDQYLLETIPTNIIIHKIEAFSERWTRKIGLGGIAYRAIYFYWKFVNALLLKSKFDLIFFSTTAYPLTILGRIWKSKFNIPYIIDMQDPWRSDHYLKLPKSQRPPKFWISYILDAIFERYVMNKVDGIISVSQKYIDVLQSRYARIKTIPTSVIPFAALEADIEVVRNNKFNNPFFNSISSDIKIVYIGRGGNDMIMANSIFLKAIKYGLAKYSDFKRIKIYFIGTSYDTSNNATKSIEPIAVQLNIQDMVVEVTNRIPYFESLKVLSDADILFVPGSDNIGYTASKIYAYAWFNKPMLTIFHSSSSVNNFMKECNAGLSLNFDNVAEEKLINEIIEYIHKAMNNEITIKINWEEFDKYTASYQVKKQVGVFNQVVNQYGA